MGTRVKVTYVAIGDDDNKPITSAGSFEDLRKSLDEYYGCHKGTGEFLGYTPYYSKYPDEYEGYFEYKSEMVVYGVVEENVDKIKIYSVDFYPHTVYEVLDNNHQL